MSRVGNISHVSELLGNKILQKFKDLLNARNIIKLPTFWLNEVFQV